MTKMPRTRRKGWCGRRPGARDLIHRQQDAAPTTICTTRRSQGRSERSGAHDARQRIHRTAQPRTERDLIGSAAGSRDAERTTPPPARGRKRFMISSRMFSGSHAATRRRQGKATWQVSRPYQARGHRASPSTSASRARVPRVASAGNCVRGNKRVSDISPRAAARRSDTKLTHQIEPRTWSRRASPRGAG